MFWKLSADTFIHQRTRKTTTKSIVSVTVAIVVATIIAVLVATAVGYNPGTLISDLFTKAFIDYKTLIFNIVVLGIGALSFSFAFRVGTFNIGIPGQMLTAGMTVLAIGYALRNVDFPQGSGQIFMLIIAFSAAALIGTISSILNVFLKVDIVVSAILINWIAFFLIRFIIQHYYPNPDSTGIVANSVAIPSQFLLVAPGIGGWLPAMILFLILVVGMWFLFKFSVYGKKIIAVGLSFTGAKYAGYNTKVLMISSMTISSGLAGILGYVLYTSGSSPNIPASMTSNALPTEGFNGIAIGLIAMLNPIAIIPVSFIIGLFETSAPFLNTPGTFSQLIIGIVMLGATLFIVFLWFKPWLWLKDWIYGYRGIKDYKKYENEMDALISKYWSEYHELRLYYKLKKHNPYQLLALLVNDYDRYKMVLNHTYSQAIKSLFLAYTNEKKRIKAEYQKHNLLATASKYFNPEIQKERNLEKDLHEFDQYYLNYINFTKQRIFRLEDKIDFLQNRSKKDLSLKTNRLVSKVEKLEDHVRQENSKHELEREKLAQQIMARQAKVKVSKDKIERVYNDAMKKAQKINLDQEEKTLLINWIQESYQSAMNDKEKGL